MTVGERCMLVHLAQKQVLRDEESPLVLAHLASFRWKCISHLLQGREWPLELWP